MQTSRRGRTASFNKRAGPFKCKDDFVDMFNGVDTDCDGYWSMEEFVCGVDSHKLFAKMLSAVALPVPE